VFIPIYSKVICVMGRGVIACGGDCGGGDMMVEAARSQLYDVVFSVITRCDGVIWVGVTGYMVAMFGLGVSAVAWYIWVWCVVRRFS
jgi:hypothetical protein